MRALPGPAIPVARQAAAQLSSRGASSTILGKRGSLRGDDGAFLARYQEWQGYARRFARQIGAASFSASVIADCCARSERRVEERIDGEWVETTDPLFAGILDEFSNPLQTEADLVRLHAWHYQVAGEMLLTQRDGEYGVEYGIYSVAAAEWETPLKDWVTIKLVPDGKVDRETAFALPRDQTVRLWIPDQEWQAFAWSPMAASVDDLKRWRSLARYVLRTSDSQLAMNGLLWAPGQAFEEPPPLDLVDEMLEAVEIGDPKNLLEEGYFSAARLRFTDDEDVSAIAPHMVHWDKDFGPPQWVKLGEPLDPEGIAHRKEALEDFARSSNLPVTTVLGGGVGDANHWSEWLASRKFYDSGVAPTMNRICHLDLTRAYLWPRARAAGYGPEQLANLRIGYDPTPVLVKEDNSDMALKLNRAGLLRNGKTLEAAGFDEADMMPEGIEQEWLLAVLAGKKAGDPLGGGDVPQVPVGPGNVVEAPPVQPTAPPALGASVSRSRVAAVLADALSGVARLAYSDDQPRADDGKFGAGAGDAAEQSDPKDEPGTASNPIDGITSADEALALIAEGKYVEMDPDLVAVSLERLAEISKEARDAGEKAPLYDLCNITSGDTSLFCGESVVASRLDMPQLGGIPLPGSPAESYERNDRGEVDITGRFLDQLASEGVTSTKTEVDAGHLKASQNELNGAKVAGMMQAIQGGTMPTGAIMVSRDNYVIDGHHRWAAEVGATYTGGARLTMPVVRIDMPIQQVLERANAFAAGQGLPQMQAALR